MANEEWKRLQEALRKTATPEARTEAAEAMRRYQTARLAKGKGSRPTIVSLALKKGYPNAVPLDKAADEIERNPAFFELMKRIATKEK